MCSTPFVVLGKAQLKAMGYADVPIAVIPHPFGLRTPAEIREIAEKCVDDIARLACAAAAQSGGSSNQPEVRRAERVEAPLDQGEFDDFAEARRWTDGFPLVAPTQERVERMLRHTRRKPDEVIGYVQPGFGTATVERIAINAVMAGCRPEFLPALIATVAAAVEKPFNLQGMQATTNPATPWIIVNGPAAKALNVNGGINCLGQGNRANATIGRALRLIMQNIGGCLPGEMDRATQGQPGKYSFCCAENEEQSPWDPLHVERGFEKSRSTITVVGAAGTQNVNSHSKNGHELLRVMADSMRFPTSNDYHFGGQPWLIISPEHAEILHRDGYGKADVKRELERQSGMVASRFADKDYERARHSRGEELGGMTPDTIVPITRTRNDIGIIVAGGPGTHSVYVHTFGQTRAVTKPIDE